MEAINKRKRPIAAVLGLFIVVFTLIGIISTIVGAVNLVRSWFDESKKYLAYERAIYPVVMFDPVPFSSPAAADPGMLQQSALWATLLNQDNSLFSTDDIGFMLVPSSDLDVWAKRLYGDAVTIEHTTINGDTDSFYYDETAKMYHVPANVTVVHYTPRVKSVVKNGNLHTLEVEYISPMSMASNIFSDDAEPIADKTMYYVVEEVDSGYRVRAVQYTPDGTVEEYVPSDESLPEESLPVESVDEEVSEETSSEDISSAETSSEETSSTDSSDTTASGDASEAAVSSEETSSEQPLPSQGGANI